MTGRSGTVARDLSSHETSPPLLPGDLTYLVSCEGEYPTSSIYLFALFLVVQKCSFPFWDQVHQISSLLMFFLLFSSIQAPPPSCSVSWPLTPWFTAACNQRRCFTFPVFRLSTARTVVSLGSELSGLGWARKTGRPRQLLGVKGCGPGRRRAQSGPSRRSANNAK